MPQAHDKQKFTMGSFLLYMLGFLLFWEWLRPLSTFTDTHYLSIFVLFAAFLFTISYFELPIWLSFPLKLLALAYAIHTIYFPVSFFDLEWVSYLINDLIAGFDRALARDWNGLSNLSRTFLFLVLLWLISYLMHYWLIQARRIFLFFLITVLYVTVVDTFTPYDASASIIRTVIIGFVLLGILQFIRIIELKGFNVYRNKFPLMWIIPLVLLISFSSVLGYLAPKAAPQWPDPVPFFTATGSQIGEGEGDAPGRGGGVQRIGYGTNDSRLGGPFISDETPIFKTTIEELHYWRVESKEIYTGLGWETATGNPNEQVDPDNIPKDSIHAMQFSEKVKAEQLSAKVEVLKKGLYPFIVYPGQLDAVQAEEPRDYEMNTITRKLMTLEQGRESGLKEYSLDYTYPEFSEAMLAKSSMNYPEEITSRYLQLPKDLPQRVQDLSEEITAEATNPYEMAKAVEEYFAKAGFSYNTRDTAVPGKNDDYVDQFLFDTQLGYCDNFSTSMAVMLRTVGIPTRWVKGFTRGEYEDTLEDGVREYVITNSNAHSWVEVYFEGVGWVPFEPTRGFQAPDQFVDNYQDETEEDVPVEQNDQDQQKTDKDAGEKKSSFTLPFDVDKVLNWVKWISITILSVALVVLITAYLTRKKWLNKFFLWKFRKRKDDHAFQDAYHRLLWLLEQYGIEKQPQQTLREYAVDVDRSLDTGDMKLLTKKYEKARYSPGHQPVDWQDTKELWENLIKRIRP
ncbi:transglutaminase domain-containing protein [Pseudalkalibacillus sp. SCS-8]|uniref:transglutaminase domain-containing protein n=1 Tax=Pseudalkalibacillus nanhaiensis TaxID=3115291 RepID=UPI0032DAF6AC